MIGSLLAGCIGSPLQTESSTNAQQQRAFEAALRAADENLTRAREDASRARSEASAAELAMNETRAQLDQEFADALHYQSEWLAALNEAESLHDALAAQTENVTQLKARMNAPRAGGGSDSQSVRELKQELAAAQENLKQVREQYSEALAGRFRTIATIEAGNVSWHFVDLRGDARSWTFSLDSYRAYVKASRPIEQLHLGTDSGRTIDVADLRPYVTPSFFKGVISDVAAGRTARDFVRETFNLKRQFVVYNLSLVDKGGFYKYPAEVMTEGTGVCGDTTILLASLLIAGEQREHFGLKVGIWIVELDPTTGTLSERPEHPNHAIVEVTYPDGSRQAIETTTKDFVTYHDAWNGWEYDLDMNDTT